MGKKNTKPQKPGVMIYFEILPQLEMLKPLQRLAVFDAILAYGKDHTEPVLKREAALAWGFIKPILDRDDERYFRSVEARSKGGKTRAAKARNTKNIQDSAETCSAVLSSAETCSAVLSSAEACSAVLSSAEACSTCQSTIYNPQSTISNPQSTISNPQSTISNPQSAISNPQSSNINPQSSVVRESVTVSGSASEILGFAPPSLPQVKEFVFQEGLRFLPEDFVDYYNANGWMIGKQPIQDWKAVARRWSRKEKVHDDNPFKGYDLGPHC